MLGFNMFPSFLNLFISCFSLLITSLLPPIVNICTIYFMCIMRMFYYYYFLVIIQLEYCLEWEKMENGSCLSHRKR